MIELLRHVRLDERKLDAYPHQMSNGEQQRVAVARAIATNPELIVLDEPTSMLDLSVRAEIIDLLIALQEEFGLSYLFISHDLTTVEYICHRVAVMYLSEIVELGTVDAGLRLAPASLQPGAPVRRAAGRPARAALELRARGRDPEPGQPAARLPSRLALPRGDATPAARRRRPCSRSATAAWCAAGASPRATSRAGIGGLERGPRRA